jgi:hypothetical protein
MLNLDLGDIVSGPRTPSDLDMVYYLFFINGVSFREFEELPIPYILSICETHAWIKKQEEKAMKKRS